MSIWIISVLKGQLLDNRDVTIFSFFFSKKYKLLANKEFFSLNLSKNISKFFSSIFVIFISKNDRNFYTLATMTSRLQITFTSLLKTMKNVINLRKSIR